VPIAGLDLDTLAAAVAPLAAAFAGVPSRLDRFRAGDESLIGVDKLSGAGDQLATGADDRPKVKAATRQPSVQAWSSRLMSRASRNPSFAATGNRVLGLRTRIKTARG